MRFVQCCHSEWRWSGSGTSSILSTPAYSFAYSTLLDIKLGLASHVWVKPCNPHLLCKFCHRCSSQRTQSCYQELERSSVKYLLFSPVLLSNWSCADIVTPSLDLVKLFSSKVVLLTKSCVVPRLYLMYSRAFLCS